MTTGTLSLPKQRRARRPSLTPMIDVVFLLLVFFMLASRFGHDGVIALAPAGTGGSAYSGPPRLVGIAPEAITLNGAEMTPEDLPERLSALMETPEDKVILRAAPGTDLQRLVEVMEALTKAGMTGLVLVE